MKTSETAWCSLGDIFVVERKGMLVTLNIVLPSSKIIMLILYIRGNNLTQTVLLPTWTLS